jgi:hypothetical protein
VGLESLAKLDLLVVTLLRVELRAESVEFLSILGLLVAFTSGLLAGTFLVIETGGELALIEGGVGDFCSSCGAQ